MQLRSIVTHLAHACRGAFLAAGGLFLTLFAEGLLRRDVLLRAEPAPGNIYVTPLRFKLGGRPVLSTRFNVETAGSERKRPEI
jgi:hypothetical protein